MGTPDDPPEPGLHPLDRVAAGLPTLAPPPRPASSDAPDLAADAPDDETDELDDDLDFGLSFPWGAVPQAPHLPPGQPSAQTANGVNGATEAEPAAKPKEPLPPVGEPATDEEREQMRAEVVQTLKTIFDPEIPVDIYALGLIYTVDVKESRDVEIRMTLTSPNCPAAQSLPGEVETRSAAVGGVRSAMVDIVWDPPWGPELMSDEAKLELNIDM